MNGVVEDWDLKGHAFSSSGYFAFIFEFVRHVVFLLGQLASKVLPMKFARRCSKRISPVRVVKLGAFLSLCWYLYGAYIRSSIVSEAGQILIEKIPAGECPLVDNKNSIQIGQALHDFVHEEMPNNPDYHGITVYPWVLTMTAALRFGGNAIFDGDDLYLADHDIDIFLNGQLNQMSKPLAAQLQSEMIAYIGKKLGMWTWFEPERLGHPTAFLMRPIDFSQDFSQMGWWAIVSSGVASVLSNRLRGEFPQSWIMNFAAYIIDTPWIRNFVAGPISAHITTIDFHRQPAKPVWPSPFRRVKWAGRSWPYPLDETIYIDHFRGYVGRNSLIENLNITSICDFYEPQLRWPSDAFIHSPRKHEILQVCGDGLEADGFYNLNHCRDEALPLEPYVIGDVWPDAVEMLRRDNNRLRNLDL